MKNDLILSALINFLVPIIFLYGLFFLADFFETGFFAFIYSVVLFVSGFMIFSVRFSGIKPLTATQFEFASFFILLLSISYIAGILFLITNLFSIQLLWGIAEYDSAIRHVRSFYPLKAENIDPKKDFLPPPSLRSSNLLLSRLLR